MYTPTHRWWSWLNLGRQNLGVQIFRGFEVMCIWWRGPTSISCKIAICLATSPNAENPPCIFFVADAPSGLFLKLSVWGMQVNSDSTNQLSSELHQHRQCQIFIAPSPKITPRHLHARVSCSADIWDWMCQKIQFPCLWGIKLTSNPQ